MLDHFNQEDAENERSIKASADYLSQANEARAAGDADLAVSLYMAAFDCATKESTCPSEDCIAGLKTAWELACQAKQRTLAEYIFERLEPFLSQSDVAFYAKRLQDLAMDKLEEFGVSRAELEDIMEQLPQDLLGGMLDVRSNLDNAAVDVVGQPGPVPLAFASTPEGSVNLAAFGFPSTDQMQAFMGDLMNRLTQSMAPSAPSAPEQRMREACACSDHEQGQDEQGLDADECVCAESATESASTHILDDQARQLQKTADANMPSLPHFGMQGLPPFTFFSPAFFGGQGFAPRAADASEPEPKLDYQALAGFDRAIEKMHSLGIGLKGDPAFEEFIAMLNEKHGVEGMPAVETIVFRSEAREDASHFMEATFGELDLPGIRMHVEENAQGNLVLCVMAQTHAGLKLNAARNEIVGSGALLLEDIDVWSHLIPLQDDARDVKERLSKGAREALCLIRSAVENPNVTVLASCSTELGVDGFLLDMLEPLTLVDIDLPTESERRCIWKDIMEQHPSVEDANLEALVAYSKGLPRFDMYMAAREAVDAAYKASLNSRAYEPVTTALLCEKLASYQPLDSSEYKSLEDAVIEDFREELDCLDEYFSVDAEWEEDNLDLGEQQSFDE